MNNNLIVAQSGGPTAAINSSLAGVINQAVKISDIDRVYGSVHGIQGVIKDQFIEFTDWKSEDITKLSKTPAMYLGSCRFKLPEISEDEELYKSIFDRFNAMKVGFFVYIGGNDSMDTVVKLSEYARLHNHPVKIAGVPKTIDNDLIITDHTPGFGSAAKYVASTIREIAYDTYIYDTQSVTIVEVMGRDAGWLTAASGLSRTKSSPAPHLIYLPEVAFSKENFIEDVKKNLERYKNIVVAVSEGIHDKSGSYVSADTTYADKFGHSQLSGAGKVLEHLVKDKLGVKVRSIELNVLQRCAGHIISKTDFDEAFAQGEYAVTQAVEGATGFMSAIRRLSDMPYTTELFTVDVNDVANKAKPVPESFINEFGNNITKSATDYLTPLIQGEVPADYDGGVVDYLPVSHLVHHKVQ
ncbi:MAG: 6-phosphofructokinase [Lachnospiraceae bacterium]|nr:6-phosphofructokinase [Lachnospiraceae bacterium]